MRRTRPHGTATRSRQLALCVLALVGLAATTLVGLPAPDAKAVSGPTADWMQYRYDASRTAFNPDETTIGAADVADLRRVWFKGPAQTNIVVEHGHVLTCASGSCYNRLLDNGQLVWKIGMRVHGRSVLVADDQLWTMNRLLRVGGVRLSDGRFTRSFGQPGGLNTPVAFHAGRIFGSGFHGHVNAFSVTRGVAGWTSAKLFDLGETGTPGSPSVGANRVFVGECAAVGAFREDNGRFRWLVPVPGGCTQMPVVVGGRVVASTSAVTALDATTGAQLWSTPGDGGTLLSPAAAYDRVYAVAPTAGTIAAYDIADGHRLWSTPTDAAWPPSVANGVVYAVGPTGLHTFDASTGAPIATIPGSFTGEVVVAEGHVLLNCVDATLGSGICVYAS